MTTLTRHLPRNTQFLRNARLSPSINHQFQFLSSPSSTTLQLLKRHASTTSSSSTTVSNKSPSSQASLINGPPSTLPAPLTIPPRTPSTSLPSHLLSIGKTYLAFYKTGVKNIYHNFKLSRPIQRLIDTSHRGSLTNAISSGALTRHDLQLLVRNWHDMKRIPIFALVFMICGEFTPLVVVLVSNVVPWTCRIPKQIEGDRRKLEKRRGISFRNLTEVPPGTQVMSGNNDGRLEVDGVVDGLKRMQLLHISWSLGLSSSVWDYLGGRLPGLPTWILRKRVKRRVEYLGFDDGLIRKGGGVGLLQGEEVKIACVERGINVLDRSDDALRVELGNWLKSAEKISIEHLLLTRPSVWPVRKEEKLKVEGRKSSHHKEESKSEGRKKVYV